MLAPLSGPVTGAGTIRPIGVNLIDHTGWVANAIDAPRADDTISRSVYTERLRLIPRSFDR
jgi:hypothetical protein